MAAHQSLSLLLSPSRQVADTGLTVVYEPKIGEPVVDIILIHGLQGHPLNTWAAEVDGANSNVLNKLSGKARGLFSKKPAPETSSATDKDRIFWPRDLLPDDCPRARISVFGYNTVVARHQLAGAANKNSVFAHSRDLVNEICRHRPPGRPTIFVTHSLGGILIKEVLAACSTSNDADVRDILESTAGIVFLGTPHRGSSAAGIGEIARKAASVLLMDTNSLILDSLALKNSDLVRCQEIFSALWHKHNFAVKTFQEGLPLKLPIKIGQSKMVKVVPDESSCLGDARERAEILTGDHRSICRFSTKNDPNYRKVAADLINQYSALLPKIQTKQDSNRLDLRFSDARLSLRRDPFNPTGSSSRQGKLDLLKYNEMLLRQDSISTPAKDTCQWLLQAADDFQTWLTRTNIDEHFGLLQITGKPGSGKSTLMKETLEIIRSRHHPDTGTCVASHFFSRRGSPIEHSAQGMFRSILYQICAAHPVCLDSFTDQEIQFLAPSDSPDSSDDANNKFRPLAEILERIMQSAFAPKATFILIDALDECNQGEALKAGYLLAGLARDAFDAGIWLNICITRREYPSIIVKSLRIRMENHNSSDIRQYVHRRLELLGVSAHQSAEIEDTIVLGASSIFLWAVLATDRVFRDFEHGINARQILRRTRTLPEVLEDVFTEMLKDINPEDVEVTLRLFQWAVLATDRLRIREWHHILAFIRESPPLSLEEWGNSEFYTETDVELARQIRRLSKGLIEIQSGNIEAEVSEEVVDDIASHLPGAGSLDSNNGDSRFVQTIHESVREFFISDRANKLFGKPDSYDFVREGHQTITTTCLEYVQIREFDDLVAARRAANRRIARITSVTRLESPGPYRILRRKASATSFMSSASSHSDWNQGGTTFKTSHDALAIPQSPDFTSSAPPRPGSSIEEESGTPEPSTSESDSSEWHDSEPSLLAHTDNLTRRFLIQNSAALKGSLRITVKSTGHEDQPESKPSDFQLIPINIPCRRFGLYSRLSPRKVFGSKYIPFAKKNTKNARKSQSLPQLAGFFPLHNAAALLQPRRRKSSNQINTLEPQETGGIRLWHLIAAGVFSLQSHTFNEQKWHAFNLSGTTYWWQVTESHNEARTQSMRLVRAGDQGRILAYIHPSESSNSSKTTEIDDWITPSEVVIFKRLLTTARKSHSELTEEIVISTGLMALLDNRIKERSDHSCTDSQTGSCPQGSSKTSGEDFMAVKASLVLSWWQLNSMAEPWRGTSTRNSLRDRDSEDEDEDDRNSKHDNKDGLNTPESTVRSRLLGGYTALASYALNRVERHAALGQGIPFATRDLAHRRQKGWQRWEILKGRASKIDHRLVGWFY